MTNFKTRIIVVPAVLLAEIVGIAVAYQFFATVNCSETGAQAGCELLRSLVARSIVSLAALGFYFWARPEAYSRLLHLGRARKPPARWVWGAHLIGVGLILLPLIVGGARNMTGEFYYALIPWLSGLALAGATGVALAAPLGVWRDWLRMERFRPLPILFMAIVIPDVANNLLPLWSWQALTGFTFDAVVAVLFVFASGVYADPGTYIIGTESFRVHISSQCSGLEGITLVTVFIGFYWFLFRRDLHFIRFWLIMLPLGLLLSWILNVVRIASLVMIGTHISPEIAVKGFHSYAGWLFFTVLAVFLLFVAQVMPWIHRHSSSPSLKIPLREDWFAARIIPFVAFMVVGILTSAISVHPDLAYPLTTVVLLLTLAYFRRQYWHLISGVDPVAIAGGILVGTAWIVFQPPPSATDAALATTLNGLGATVLTLWIISRLIGTMLLVPVVEELFFRGYLLGRLDTGGRTGQIFAVVASSALFAVLHGRWIEAFVAGVILALIMIRRGRLGDAILAHVVANSLIAVWALATGTLTAI
ncbi:hypothetical protein SAMN04490248_104129 [Salinihabitans flavidus]|uniref:CAAX prenyl protease 2/Lysostaphin resistance protein A-like domain-containing protein n=1 Tax=Salinihabitans flavidus TaxID=569882 RepID=A0A1H8P3R1_9RHOB|nr:exosortase E/protease, VPEID-CTERM system [Salinihabitans flavidus]SEO36569.1 hypothetical protein SAMN04490248_104129 [Salinihabitans flavidus]